MNDILQEFIAESKELLAQAQSDLLRLEKAPTDATILGSIFRAFHTLKGGAGFLDAPNMVVWCHHLENLLDKLRSAKLVADSGMIDAILRSTDVIARMLEEMARGENPSPSPPDLAQLIQSYAGRGPQTAADQPQVQAEQARAASPGTWVEGREQDNGHQGLYVEQKAAPTITAPLDELDALFEQTLDKVYGKGVAPGDVHATPVNEPQADVHATQDVEARASPSHRVSAQPQTHAAESADSSIRVDSARLDQAMNQVGELVLLRNRLAAAVARADGTDEAMMRLVRETDLAVNDLQSTVMRLRMQPCKRLFQSLPRVVRDASRTLGKKVRLEVEGEDVEIDKTVIDALSGPLIHLVRNALDHGLEEPGERAMAGKSEEGTLRAEAIHLGDKVQIRISDDGRGMNPRKILHSALSKGLISEADGARLSEREMLDLIFLPGFSTKDKVSELSGRGVGMDVVRAATQSLRGRVDIATRASQGTTMTLELPLTLAVLPVLYFRLRREMYALPVSAVDNLMEIDPRNVHRISGRPMYQIDAQHIVPYIDLGQQLQNIPLRLSRDACEGILTEQGLLVVSEAISTEDSVVKPLDVSAQSSWYQGATISGKGKVVLILDTQALTRAARRTEVA